MRFLADEGISPKTIDWLRQQGHDVIGAREQNLYSVEDRHVLALALANQSALLTRDIADFSRIAHLTGEPHYGIILLRPGKNETALHINSLLAKFIGQFPDLDLAGRIVVISPKRIRFRPPLK